MKLIKSTLSLILLSAFALASKAQTPSIVKDSWTGARGTNPMRMMVFGNRLCFYGTDSLHNAELWEYNDEDAPRMVHDIYAGNHESGRGGEGDHMAIFGNKLYFLASEFDSAKGTSSGLEMFVYDGSSTPKMAFDLGKNGLGSAPSSLVVVGSKLFFKADSNSSNYFIYSYDGVNPPRFYVPEPYPVASAPRSLGEFRGQLFFCDSAPGAGAELFELDPATGNRKLAADIDPGSGWSQPHGWLTAWNKLFFLATTAANGTELYSYDGVTAKRLTDLAPGTKSTATGYLRPIAYKGGIYFSGSATGATSPQGVYKWDSATGTTSLISPVGMEVTNNFRAAVFDNSLYFYGKTSAAGWEVWKYDGSSCTMVTDLNPGAADGVSMREFAIYNNRLYFAGTNGKTGLELYRISASTNSVTSIQWQGKAFIYPNPANTIATLSITLPSVQSLRVTLTDVNGRVVFNSGLKPFNSGANEIALPVANLAAGQYFYRIDNGDGVGLAQGAVVRQ